MAQPAGSIIRPPAGINAGAGLPGKSPAFFDFDDLFKPVEEVRDTDPVSVLVVGPQGSWKTSALASIPETYADGRPVRVLYMDADQRLKVIRKPLPHWTKVDVPYDPDNSDVVYNRYRAVSAAMGMGKPEYQFNVVVMDTLTPLMEVLWNRARKEITDENEYSEAYDSNKKQFGFVQKEAKKIIFSLKSAADLFICIAHDKEPYFQETDPVKKKFTADVVGSLKTFLPKLFQEVYYTVRNPDTNNEWWWLTGSLGQREGRNSYSLPLFVPQRYDLILNRQWEALAELGKGKLTGQAAIPTTPATPAKTS